MSSHTQKITNLIRNDVVESIEDVGPSATAEEYDVEYDPDEPWLELVERCVASELKRCYS